MHRSGRGPKGPIWGSPGPQDPWDPIFEPFRTLDPSHPYQESYMHPPQKWVNIHPGPGDPGPGVDEDPGSRGCPLDPGSSAGAYNMAIISTLNYFLYYELLVLLTVRHHPLALHPVHVSACMLFLSSRHHAVVSTGCLSTAYRSAADPSVSSVVVPTLVLVVVGSGEGEPILYYIYG